MKSDSIEFDKEYMFSGKNQIPMSDSVKDRMDILIAEIDELMERLRKYFWAGMIFVVMSFVFMGFGLIIGQLGALAGVFVLLYMQLRLQKPIDKRFGFIDGMMFCV